MAASLTALSPLILLVALSLLPVITLSQDPASPTIAQCATRLLPLAPCGPFVQGSMSSPGQTCCDNLKQISTQQPHCLCLLLNDTTLSSFPINSSLALQLPLLCSLQVDISVCSPGANGSTSPGSQVSLGSRETNSSTGVNSTAAASPMFQTVPRSDNNTVGHGLAKNGGNNLKTASDFEVVMIAALIAFVITEFAL